MNIDLYIDSAKRRIKAVPEYGRGNRYYLRNRITEIALYLLANDYQNWREFFKYSIVDTADSQERADHYGVKVGDPIIVGRAVKRRRQARDDFDVQSAKYMRLLKNSIDIEKLEAL